jgi:hypothetical protein
MAAGDPVIATAIGKSGILNAQPDPCPDWWTAKPPVATAQHF